MTSPFQQKAWKSDANGEGDFENPEPGPHPAVLVALIDLGTHTESFGGQKPRDVRKVFLVWELTASKKTSGENFVVGKEFSNSFHEKANLRQFIEKWFSKRLPDGSDFDMTKLLGQKCMLNLVGKQSAAGKDVVNVSDGTKPHASVTVPATTLKPFMWVVGDSMRTLEEAGWLPYIYGIKPIDKVLKCHEMAKKGAAEANREEHDVADSSQPVEDGVPF